MANSGFYLEQTKEEQRSGVDILGVRVHQVDFAATLAQIGAWVAGAQGAEARPIRQICTVNPEFIMEARRNRAFASVLRSADLCVPDGVGVMWAARLAGCSLPERVTGSDGIYRICARAADEGWRVFLLGAAPGVAARAARVLGRRYPQLNVVGTYSGSPAAAEWREIYARLETARPDILFVAFGHPHQDLWIHRHRHEIPAAVAMGIGGAFDFVAGVTVRAPVWMRRTGLEWLHRLMQQPWRWRRMTRLPLFMLLAVWSAYRRRMSLRSPEAD